MSKLNKLYNLLYIVESNYEYCLSHELIEEAYRERIAMETLSEAINLLEA